MPIQVKKKGREGGFTPNVLPACSGKQKKENLHKQKKKRKEAGI